MSLYEIIEADDTRSFYFHLKNICTFSSRYKVLHYDTKKKLCVTTDTFSLFLNFIPFRFHL